MKAEELLELINDEIVIDIMEENGSPVMGRGTTSDGSPYLIFRTICHGGDSNKLYYYSESKTFHCWTNCGTMNFYTCISKIRGYSQEQFLECLSYVGDKVGVSVRTSHYGFGNTRKEDDKDVFKYQKLLEERCIKPSKGLEGIKNFYDEDDDLKLVEYFDNHFYYQGWVDEGISPETMDKFKIGWYGWENWITIPCFNYENRLIGIRRRALDIYYNGQWYPPKDKYKPLEFYDRFYSFPTSKALYGENFNKNIIKSSGECVLFEGEKSVMIADSLYGEYPSVAVYGSSVSDWQIQELKRLGAKKIYLAFDKDYEYGNENLYKDTPEYAGYKFSKNKREHIIKKISSNFNTYVITDIKGRLDLKDSPIDKGKETFEFLFKKASPARDFIKD